MIFVQLSFAQEHELKDILAALVLRASKAETSISDADKLMARRCEMLTKYVGFKDTPMGKAMKYSCDAPQIGIAFYAGPDLGDYPPEQIERVFLDRIGDRGLKAKVFTDLEHEHGSSVVFFVHGDTYLRNAVDPVEALSEVKNLINETKLIFMAYRLVTKWPDGKVVN